MEEIPEEVLDKLAMYHCNNCGDDFGTMWPGICGSAMDIHIYGCCVGKCVCMKNIGEDYREFHDNRVTKGRLESKIVVIDDKVYKKQL